MVFINKIFLIGFLVFAPSLAVADVLSAFFSKDSIRNIFGTDIQVRQAKPIVLQRPIEELKEASSDEKLAEAEKPELVDAKFVESNLVSDQEQSLEKLLKEKYGDPNQPHPVQAIDNAPAPFKAMIEALQAGDKELAFKYGIQYTKYKQNLIDVNQQAVSLIGQSMVRDGVMSADSWASSPSYSEDIYLRNLDLSQQEKISKKTQQPGVLHDQAKVVLARAKEAAFADFSEAFIPSDVISLELDEEEERAKARKELRGKLPVDPKGEVDVYFFFEPQDSELWPYAKDIEFLHKEIEKDQRVNFIGATLQRYNAQTLHTFKLKSKAEFPTISGSSLAKAMGVSSSPTVLFVARTTNKFHMETKLQNFYYLDEARKMMQGEKA